jgi:hypothetical protein
MNDLATQHERRFALVLRTAKPVIFRRNGRWGWFGITHCSVADALRANDFTCTRNKEGR